MSKKQTEEVLQVTKLKMILVTEKIKQNKLCEVIEDNELEKDKPGVHPATLSLIINGDTSRSNPTRSTMQKILDGINKIMKDRGSDKVYSLGDIID